MNKVVMFGLILAGAVFCGDVIGGMFCRYEVTTIEHTVRRGETVWDIAGQYYHLEERDGFAEFVWRVNNGRANKGHIHPGEVIAVSCNREVK